MRSKRAKWVRETQPNLFTGSSQDVNRITRQQRNLAEKQRRDRLNGYINELARIVPLVALATRRMDKTSILRLSAAQLRIHQTFATQEGNGRHQQCVKNNYVNRLLEDIGGFLLLATGSGKILYVSPSVEQHLRHRQTDMIGHSLLLFVHPSDVGSIHKQLESHILAIKNTGSPQRFQFTCQMKEQQRSHSENPTYRAMKFTGYLTYSNNQRKNDEQESPFLGVLLKAFVEPPHPQINREMSLTDAIQDEYITRHHADGTIVFADHRLSTITGHLPHEVCGNSAYKYIRTDDILIAMFAHKMMFKNGRGLIVYRLRTRNNEYVYLQTMGFIKYKSSSSEIEYFTCVNKLLTEEEGNSELHKFSERFSPHISQTTASSLYEIISSPQESRSLSSPSFCEDNLLSPSECISDSELLHRASFMTQKVTVSNTTSPSSAKLMTKCLDVKESSVFPFSTNASVMPTIGGKSSWIEEGQNDNMIASNGHSVPSAILQSEKTKVSSQANEDPENRIKTLCDIENPCWNGIIQGNGTEAMETYFMQIIS